ncbi:MAG: hypothetical protein H0W42_02910 [Gemmatimonadaceae bacterium]|nr:hypothetical protein [Gemmatimonadaceae bacterium]
MKSVFASKTIWLNVITLLVAMSELTDVTALVPNEYHATFLAVVALLNVILRTLTTQAVVLDTPAGVSRMKGHL